MAQDQYHPTHVEISKRLVTVNSVSTVLTMTLEVLFNFWLYQYLIRRITPEEYSLFPIVMSIMVFTPLLTVFFTSGVDRYIIDAYARGEEKEAICIVSSILPPLTLCSLLLLVLGGLVALTVDHMLIIPQGLLGDVRLMIFLLFTSLAYSIFAIPFKVGIEVKQKFLASNMLMLARVILKIAILFGLFFSSGVWVVWVVVANTSSTVIFMTIRMVYSRRLLPGLKYRVRQFDFSKARTILSFGLWSFMVQAADSLRLAMHPIVLNLFATPMDVTCYHIGSAFRRHTEHHMMRIFANLQPAFIAMHSTDQRQRFENTFHRGNRYFMWSMLFMAMPLFIFRNELITLYVGPKFIMSAMVLGLLYLASPLEAGISMLNRAANAMGRMREIAPFSVGLQLVNLAVAVYMVRNLQMGAVGSALSTFLVGIVGVILIWIPISVRLLKVPLRDWINRSFIPGVLPSIFGSVIWYALNLWHAPATWFELGSFFGVGALVYLVSLIFLGLNQSERKDLNQAYEKIMGRFK